VDEKELHPNDSRLDLSSFAKVFQRFLPFANELMSFTFRAIFLVFPFSFPLFLSPVFNQPVHLNAVWSLNFVAVRVISTFFFRWQKKLLLARVHRKKSPLWLFSFLLELFSLFPECYNTQKTNRTHNVNKTSYEHNWGKENKDILHEILL
jgi:hypothetical protein